MEIRVNFFCVKYCFWVIEDKFCMFMKRIFFDLIDCFILEFFEGDENRV